MISYRKAADLAPDEANIYANLGDVYNASGQPKSALEAYQKAVDLDPEDALSRGSLAGLYRKLGLVDEYEKQIGIARELIAQETEYNRACLEAIAGNKEQALSLLSVALEKRQVQLEWVRRDPDLESLHQELRFKQLLGE
jgi:tetratricopeptide (TPR) repeat protein